MENQRQERVPPTGRASASLAVPRPVALGFHALWISQMDGAGPHLQTTQPGHPWSLRVGRGLHTSLGLWVSITGQGQALRGWGQGALGPRRRCFRGGRSLPNLVWVQGKEH